MTSENSIKKTIELNSFGFARGDRPEMCEDDLVISVRDMFKVAKAIRDKHDGKTSEMQNALIDIEANSNRYNEILEEIKEFLLEMLNTDEDEDLKIFIGCESGQNRSVAVVCMLNKDLQSFIDTADIEDRKIKDIAIKVTHHHLGVTSFRRNKKNMNNDRSHKRDLKFSRTFKGDQ